MGVLLYLRQKKKKQAVGWFADKAQAKQFLQQLPFAGPLGSLEYEALPIWYAAEYAGRTYALTRFSFSPHGGAILPAILRAGQRPPAGDEDPGILVDAYLFPSGEAKTYIETREALYAAAAEHCRANGYAPLRAGAGDEDGEFIEAVRAEQQADPGAEWRFLFHLDPETVQAWQEAPDKTQFLQEWCGF